MSEKEKRMAARRESGTRANSLTGYANAQTTSTLAWKGGAGQVSPPQRPSSGRRPSALTRRGGEPLCSENQEEADEWKRQEGQRERRETT